MLMFLPCKSDGLIRTRRFEESVKPPAADAGFAGVGHSGTGTAK
jgi:hypothetical protein